MTREEAINEIKSWAIPSKKGREVLETLIPELRENKDENVKNKSGYYKAGKFWKASTLWNATRNKVPQRVHNRYILQECTWNIGTLQRFADEVKNVQEVSLDYPIILDMNGNIIDGAHRVVKAYLEGKDIDIVYIGDDEWPEPDYDEEKAVRESDDERIKKSLIKFLTDIKEISESGRTSWAVRKEDAEMCKSFLAWLEKQKETSHISEMCKENANSFTEDERIRQWLYDLVDEGAYLCERPFATESILAYLEKQKEEEGYEAIPVESTLEYKLGFKAGKDSEKQKEQKPSELEQLTKLREMTHEIREAYERGIEVGRAEQKSAEKQDYSGLNDLEKVIHRGFLSAGVENAPVTIIKETAQECLTQMKPTEWSEEDEGELQNAIDALEFLGKKGVYRSESGYDAALQAASWLKSLSERFNLQRKVEWSDEDKKMLSHLIDKIQENLNIRMPDGYSFGISNDEKETFSSWLRRLPERFNLSPKQEWSEEDEEVLEYVIGDVNDAKQLFTTKEAINLCDKEIAWLKSLRPQYHGDVTMTEAYKMGFEAGKASSWKPSEEQMDSLRDTIANTKGYSYSIYLPELYEQLKKLV